MNSGGISTWFVVRTLLGGIDVGGPQRRCFYNVLLCLQSLGPCWGLIEVGGPQHVSQSLRTQTEEGPPRGRARTCLLSRLLAFLHLLPPVRYPVGMRVMEAEAIVKMALTKPTFALDDLFLVDGNLLLITLETGSPRSKRYQILSGESQFFINDAMCPQCGRRG